MIRTIKLLIVFIYMRFFTKKNSHKHGNLQMNTNRDMKPILSYKKHHYLPSSESTHGHLWSFAVYLEVCAVLCCFSAGPLHYFVVK